MRVRIEFDYFRLHFLNNANKENFALHIWRFATLLRAQDISSVEGTRTCRFNPTLKWGNVEMENVFVNWKLKMRKFSALTASHSKISFFHRFDIDWMLNVEWWIEWMAEWMNASGCIVSSEWVSEWVNREINSLIARTGCAQSASSASQCTQRGGQETCECVPVCVWVCEYMSVSVSV